MKNTECKSIGYAYPSSKRATDHGYGATGCFYILTHANQRASSRGNIYGVYATESEALTAAAGIRMPFHPLSMYKGAK